MKAKVSWLFICQKVTSMFDNRTKIGKECYNKSSIKWEGSERLWLEERKKTRIKI